MEIKLVDNIITSNNSEVLVQIERYWYLKLSPNKEKKLVVIPYKFGISDDYTTKIIGEACFQIGVLYD